MKHAVIVSHPNEQSFNLTMARAYVEAARRAGDECVLRDLYRVGFDPRLTVGELIGAKHEIPETVRAERDLVADADVFVLVYPLWFNSPPAMLKGYLERVFGMGFGFEPGARGNEPLLRGRSLLSISSSGAPKSWVASTGAWGALHKLYDEHFAAVCGLATIDHLHFGDITPGITLDAVALCADQVSDLVRRNFANPSKGGI